MRRILLLILITLIFGVGGCTQFERTNPADPGGENFQPATIEGVVVSTSGVPIEGAEVANKIDDSIIGSASTDGEGKYTIPDVLPGKTYTLTASASNKGYSQVQKDNVETKPGEVSIVDFELRDVENPTITHLVVTGAKFGGEVLIPVTAIDNESVLKVEVFYKIATEESFTGSTLEEESKDTYRGVIPSDLVVIEGVDYYIYVEDASGNFNTHGSSDKPHLITVTLEAPSPTPTPDPLSPINSTVVASPTLIDADGLSQSTVTVTLKDTSDNPLGGHSVVISSGDHPTTITPSSATTDSSGQSPFTVKSTHDGLVVITATDTTEDLAIAATASITFVDVTPPGDITGFTVEQGGANGEVRGSWTNPSEGDFVGARFRYRTGGVFPTSVTDGRYFLTKRAHLQLRGAQHGVA